MGGTSTAMIQSLAVHLSATLLLTVLLLSATLFIGPVIVIVIIDGEAEAVEGENS